MKQSQVTISFNEEKLTALKLYMGLKDKKLDAELEKATASLYVKHVPVGVREFIDMRSGVVLEVTGSKKKD